MPSKNINGGRSVGTLHGRPMERLVFHYDRHEEITRYVRMRLMHYHVLLTFKNFRLVLLFQMP